MSVPSAVTKVWVGAAGVAGFAPPFGEDESVPDGAHAASTAIRIATASSTGIRRDGRVFIGSST